MMMVLRNGAIAREIPGRILLVAVLILLNCCVVCFFLARLAKQIKEYENVFSLVLVCHCYKNKAQAVFHQEATTGRAAQ